MINTEEVNGIRQRIGKLPERKDGDRFEPHLWTDAKVLVKIIEELRSDLTNEVASGKKSHKAFLETMKARSKEIAHIADTLSSTLLADHYFKRDLAAELRKV